MEENNIAIFGSGKMAKEMTEFFSHYGKKIYLFTMRKDFEPDFFGVSKVFTYSSDDTKSLNNLKKCRFIIEASKESFDRKKEIFLCIKPYIDNNQIILVNSLVQSVTRLAMLMNYPENVAGIQFFSRIEEQEMVSIIKSDFIDEKTLNAIIEFVTAFEKKSSVIEESPGYIIAKVMIPFIVGSIRILEEKNQNVESIDKIIELGMNLDVGALKIADEMGLDIIKSCLDYLYNETKLLKYKPCKLLNDMVLFGFLGKKTGKGFYNYNKEV